MQEAVLDRIQKEKTEDEWKKFHNEEANGKAGNAEPTPQQKGYIAALARAAGLSVDVSKVRDRQSASTLIERLRLLARRSNGNGFDAEQRDRRIAFGMATKLVFRRYLDQQKDPAKWKQFWKDVHAFYKSYQTEQEAAVAGSMG